MATVWSLTDINDVWSFSPSYLTCFAVGDFVEVSDGEVDGKSVKV